LRGNHECAEIGKKYGFHEDASKKLGTELLMKDFYDFFNVLPLAAVVGKKISCVHGGLSKHIKTIQDINALNRMQDVPHEGPITDLLWSDPNEDENAPDWKPSPRGASNIYGPKPVEEFLKTNHLELIVRSHELTQEGYKYSFKNGLLTIFTPPNYYYRCGNKGAILKLNDKLERKIITFEATPENLAISKEL